MWNTDRIEVIRLQSLTWGAFACNLEMKSDRKCSNCNSDEQLINGSFIMMVPPLLLLFTVRTLFDSSGMLIKTPVEIPVILDITKYLTSGYKRQSDISTYILVGSINYKGNLSKGGHYIIYLFSPKSNEVYCYSDYKANRLNFDKSMLKKKNVTFPCETHTILYIRLDCIKSKSAPLPKLADTVLDLAAVNNIDKIFYDISQFPTTLLKQHDPGTCLTSSKIIDNIINNFVLEDGSNDVSVASTMLL